MDRKAVIVLVVSLLLLFAWIPLVNHLFPPIEVPVQETRTDGTNTPPGSRSETNSTETLPDDQRPDGTRISGVSPEAPERTLMFTNQEARYVLTSHGGGIQGIELVGFPQDGSCDQRGESLTNGVVTLNTPVGAPGLALRGGGDFDGGVAYTLSERGFGQARAEATLPSGVKIIKEFTPLSNYLMRAMLRIENPTTRTVALPEREVVVGTATPIGARDDGSLLGLFYYDGEDSEHVGQGWFLNRFLGCFPGKPRPEFSHFSTRDDIHWAAVHNRFFALAVMTPTNAPARGVVARQIDLPLPSREEIEADSKINRTPAGYETSMIYPATVLEPGERLEMEFTIYAGPKEYRTLSMIGAELGNNLDYVMEYQGFFGFFAKVLLLSMNGLHELGLAYGIAIIVITVIIKILFWPLTNASTKSMKRMAALQPQMKELQEKYKDDPRKLSQKQLEFWKQHKINPLSGCLPMLVQIPVFFGFFTMLRSAVELRGARFLWACDLSLSDTIAHVFGFPLNPMPLLMGATMFWQARLTPPSPGMDAGQQKIMKYFPLIFLFILYNYSAGLTLYWTVQNLLSIAQMKLTKTVDPAGPATAKIAAPAPAPRKKK
jgi:YidC/Oxa1 family membrane protein insertase